MRGGQQFPPVNILVAAVNEKVRVVEAQEVVTLITVTQPKMGADVQELSGGVQGPYLNTVINAALAVLPEPSRLLVRELVRGREERAVKLHLRVLYTKLMVSDVLERLLSVDIIEHRLVSY